MSPEGDLCEGIQHIKMLLCNSLTLTIKIQKFKFQFSKHQSCGV